LEREKIEEFCLVLIRLRKGEEIEDLSYLFNISESHVSWLISECVPIIVNFWVPLYLKWIDRELLQNHTPKYVCQNLKSYFPVLGVGPAVIVGDCLELFIEHPINANLAFQTWSKKYEKFNTVKQFLVC